jgi:hypothetical protein
MKTRARVLATAGVLALPSLLGLAGSAAASVPPPDERPHAAVQRSTAANDDGLRCSSGAGSLQRASFGPQVDCKDAGSPTAGGQGFDAAPVRAARPALSLIGLVPVLAAAVFAVYLRRHHRPREAI